MLQVVRSSVSPLITITIRTGLFVFVLLNFSYSVLGLFLILGGQLFKVN